MRIAFVAESLETNSLGRTYSLWLLASELGWESEVISTRGERLWAPLAGTEFALACRLVSDRDPQPLVKQPDLLLVCKPKEGSLGYVLSHPQLKRLPRLIDVDDPDLEAMMRIGSPLAAIARVVRRPGRTVRDIRYMRVSRRDETLVSNPWLGERYGGTVVPHARPDRGVGKPHTSWAPNLAFVGTNRAHKGIELLRRAVDRLAPSGYTLAVTDDPPEDAQPWENWVGNTSLEGGLDLVRHSDIVALPSGRTRHSVGQLPAKLVDAMLLGRAIVVTDVPPMPWAVGRGGLVISPGSEEGLVQALRRLADPDLRSSLGAAARERALSEFSSRALTDRFAAACLAAAHQPRVEEDSIG